MKITKNQRNTILKLAAAAAIFFGLRVCPVPEGLTEQAMKFLAVFITAIFCMTVNLMKDYLILIFALVMTVCMDAADFSTAFSAFSSKTTWLLVGAFGIGAAVSRCGLMNRIAFYALKPFPKSFKGQVLALFTLGSVLCPLVPSNSAKTSLVMPFANALSKENGYQKDSKGATGLFAAGFLPISFTTFAFFSSSSLIMVAVGLMPAEYSSGIHWISWFMYSLLWFILVSLALYFLVIRLYDPKVPGKLTDEFINKRLSQLGPMSKSEISAAVILVITLVLWMTESLHGISTTAVALFALIAYHVTGVLDTKSFRTDVAWENILMCGGIVCTANLFGSLGISDWLAITLYPYIQPIISNIYIFIPMLAVLVYIMRTVVISQTASLTIFYVIFGASASSAGIHPWIIVFTLLTSGAIYNLPYQSTTYISAYGAGGNEMTEHKLIRKVSFAYMGINISALLISTLWWKITGLM